MGFDRLGRIARSQGQLEEAARSYGEALAIAKKLVAAAPINAEWQRDLAECYWKLADLAERQNKTGEAKNYWKQTFDVLSGIEKRGLHLSPKDRQYLETLRRQVGAEP